MNNTVFLLRPIYEPIILQQYCSNYSSETSRCNGWSCSGGSMCESNNCYWGTCTAESHLPVSLIILIVFFSLFTFFAIVGIYRHCSLAKRREAQAQMILMEKMETSQQH